MSFMPEEGFCCTFIENWSTDSKFEPRIWDFLSWIKSLPAYSGQYGRRPTTSSAATLTDQPFVVKLVEDGYAFMFRGAFAPRGTQDSGDGYDRIPYFELITSQYKEMEFSGDARVAVVCEAHGKRYLLNLYLKEPHIKDGGLKQLEDSQESTESGDQPASISAVDAAGLIHIANEHADAAGLVSTEDGAISSEIPNSCEQSIRRTSHTDTWTWI